MSELKQQISAATTAAMKARDKARVAALRLVKSEIQRVEVDDRRELGDDDVIAILNRMLKQRQDSLAQFEAAGREDLAATERYEIGVVREFLPEPLSDDDIDRLIDGALAASGATSMRDMGKVMAELRPQLQGRADMGAVSARVKAKLNA
ncbi:MAG: GatB/YqeY domain-containing protein [Pseudomonadales bacterium]